MVASRVDSLDFTPDPRILEDISHSEFIDGRRGRTLVVGRLAARRHAHCLHSHLMYLERRYLVLTHSEELVSYTRDHRLAARPGAHCRKQTQ
jgi:hypothetical protein